MITYETYKTLHLFFILTLFSSLGFVASPSGFVQRRLGKIALGFVSFFVFVAGMGLIARLGFKHGVPFPMWINLKIGGWFLINVLFVLLYKIKNPKQKMMISSMILLLGLGAVWVVLNKPL